MKISKKLLPKHRPIDLSTYGHNNFSKQNIGNGMYIKCLSIYMYVDLGCRSDVGREVGVGCVGWRVFSLFLAPTYKKYA